MRPDATEIAKKQRKWAGLEAALPLIGTHSSMIHEPSQQPSPLNSNQTPRQSPFRIDIRSVALKLPQLPAILDGSWQPWEPPTRATSHRKRTKVPQPQPPPHSPREAPWAPRRSSPTILVNSPSASSRPITGSRTPEQSYRSLTVPPIPVLHSLHKFLSVTSTLKQEELLREELLRYVESSQLSDTDIVKLSASELRHLMDKIDRVSTQTTTI
jgi:hypothetical protein